MATLGFSSLVVPVSVTTGAATDARSYNGFTVSLESVGTATYQVQISLDQSASPASASWQNEGSAFTSTSGTILVSKPCAWVRVNCTAYTNGTPIGRVSGVLATTKG